MTIIEELLKQLELSEKEVKVYLANLELGSALASAISKKAQINRGTTYDILRSLIQKGLVHTYWKRNKSYFSALEPEKLLRYAEQKTQQWDENKTRIEKYLPELKMLHRSSEEKPVIEFYEGKEGIISAYEDTLKLPKDSEILCYVSAKEMVEALPKYIPSYIEKRMKKGIKLRAISRDTTEGKNRAKRDKSELRQTLLVPAEKFPFTNEINIYGDKTLIVANAKEMFAVIIKSKEIAQTQRAIFELAWVETKAHYNNEY